MKNLCLVVLSVFFLLGCTSVQESAEYELLGKIPSSEASLLIPNEERYVLKYAGYEQVNGKEVAKIDVYNASNAKEFQAILFRDEAFPLTICGREDMVSISDTLQCSDSNCEKGVRLGIRHNYTPYLLSIRGSEESIFMECESEPYTVSSTVDDTNEAPHAFIGGRSFRFMGDMMIDNACKNLTNDTIVYLVPQDFWNKPEFQGFPLKRYFFRPNTIVCDGDYNFYMREESNSKECRSWLGYRSVNSIGCMNYNIITNAINNG